MASVTILSISVRNKNENHYLRGERCLLRIAEATMAAAPLPSVRGHLMHAQPRKSPAISFPTQSPALSKQAKSPAELGLKNFVICMSYKLLFHKRKTGHDPTRKSARNRREIKKSVPQSLFSLTARVCFLRMSSMTLNHLRMQEK